MIGAIVVALLVAPVGVFGQDSVNDDRPMLREGVLRHAAAAEGARLALRLQAVSQPPQQRSWVVRHADAIGFVVGGGAGAVIGTSKCSPRQPQQIASPLFCGIIGALILAPAGYVVGHLVTVITR